MESKTAKQSITLALDMCGMRGRFTVRDVAEEAYREVSVESLSQADQREAIINFLMREAKSQMKAPLREDFKEDYFKKMPEKYWPVIEKLTKTICVSNGKSAYHVLTLYAGEEDWAGFLDVADVMEKKVVAAKNSARDVRDLLRSNSAESLFELFTGKRVQRQAFIPRADMEAA